MQNRRRYHIHKTFIFFQNEKSHSLNYANSCKVLQSELRSRNTMAEANTGVGISVVSKPVITEPRVRLAHVI